MNLADYFERTESLGVLGTADDAGNVDLAVYARPHVIDDTTLAFIMSHRLTHKNLHSNPRAAYLFRESGGGYKGKRLYVNRMREETDPEQIEAMQRQNRKGHDYGDAAKSLVYFHVEKVRPLVGD